MVLNVLRVGSLLGVIIVLSMFSLLFELMMISVIFSASHMICGIISVKPLLYSFFPKYLYAASVYGSAITTNEEYLSWSLNAFTCMKLRISSLVSVSSSCVG